MNLFDKFSTLIPTQDGGRISSKTRIIINVILKLVALDAFNENGEIKDRTGGYIEKSDVIKLIDLAVTREREAVGEDAFVAWLKTAKVDTELIVNNRLRVKMGLQPVALAREGDDDDSTNNNNNFGNSSTGGSNSSSGSSTLQPFPQPTIPPPPPLTRMNSVIPENMGQSNVVLIPPDIAQPSPPLEPSPNSIARPSGLDSLLDGTPMEGIRSKNQPPSERVDPKGKRTDLDKMREINKKQAEETRKRNRNAELEEKRKTGVFNNESDQEGQGRQRESSRKRNCKNLSRKTQKDAKKTIKSRKQNQKGKRSCPSNKVGAKGGLSCQNRGKACQIGSGLRKRDLHEVSDEESGSDTSASWFSVSDSE